jgi:hypothetical protein
LTQSVSRTRAKEKGFPLLDRPSLSAEKCALNATLES